MAKRMRAEDRRAQIIERSKPLFAMNGLTGVSVNELAKSCQVNAAVLYQHFPSKVELYRAVLEEFACSRENYVEAVLAGPDDFGNLLYRMTLVFAKSREADIDILRIELRSILEEDESSDSICAAQWQGLTDYIEASLQEMIDEGVIHSLDVKVSALVYVGMVREMLICHVLHSGDSCTNKSLEYLVKQIINAYLLSVGLSALNW